jgi:hypothetical protein
MNPVITRIGRTSADAPKAASPESMSVLLFVRTDAWPPVMPGPVSTSRHLCSIVSVKPRGGEFIAETSVLGDIQLPTGQPQIQVVDVSNFTFITLDTAGHPARSEQPAHSPQHQPQESRPEEAHQNPATQPQLPAPRTSEHQGHPFQVSSHTSYEDCAAHMTIGQAEP